MSSLYDAADFHEFWRGYLRLHSRPETRRWHAVATLAAATLLAHGARCYHALMEPAAAATATAATTAAKKGNGLAIAALVLSSVFFLPIVPFFGLVLGIIAIATGRSKPMSIVAICLGAFFTLMTGIYAAIAIPAFMKYIERAKESEARVNLSSLATAAAALDEKQAAELPDADWTPAGSACAQPDHKFAVDSAAWQREPWHTLGFRIERPHYFQYRAARVSGGFRFEARADLRCNGHVTELSRDPL